MLRDGLLTPWMELDVLRCEKCGRAEFFLPSPPPEENPELMEETVVCPVCGTEHSSLIGCPTCALNWPGADGRRRPGERRRRSPPGRGNAPDRRRLNRFVTENQNFPKG